MISTVREATEMRAESEQVLGDSDRTSQSCRGRRLEIVKEAVGNGTERGSSNCQDVSVPSLRSWAKSSLVFHINMTPRSHVHRAANPNTLLMDSRCHYLLI